MVGVELPRRKRGIKGTRPSTSATRPTYRMGVGEGSRPDHPTLVEGNIGGFPHHVRKWGDSEHNILRNKLKSWISMS